MVKEGVIQVDHYRQQPGEVVVNAYGRRGRTEPLASKTFNTRHYDIPLPEFAGRFGLAYKAEVTAFADCCASNKPFPVTHRDSARAQQVIEAGMKSHVQPVEVKA